MPVCPEVPKPQPYNSSVFTIPIENDDPAAIADQDAPVGPETNTGELVDSTVLFPTCPDELRPHPYSMPVVVMASECAPPAATDVQDVAAGPDTSTGEDTVVKEPIPTCPDVLRPHPYSRPAVVMASECAAPAAITAHDVPAGPETSTGDDTVTTEFMPTCPDVFCPHPYSMPAAVMPSVYDAPAAMADHDVPAGPETNTGDETVVIELVPTCPEVFCPHPYSSPVAAIASECDAPAVIADHDALTGPDTSTGDDTVVRDPIPTCPDVLRPHP